MRLRLWWLWLPDISLEPGPWRHAHFTLQTSYRLSTYWLGFPADKDPHSYTWIRWYSTFYTGGKIISPVWHCSAITYYRFYNNDFIIIIMVANIFLQQALLLLLLLFFEKSFYFLCPFVMGKRYVTWVWNRDIIKYTFIIIIVAAG